MDIDNEKEVERDSRGVMLCPECGGMRFSFCNPEYIEDKNCLPVCVDMCELR